jgi:hypothetical protein
MLAFLSYLHPLLGQTGVSVAMASITRGTLSLSLMGMLQLTIFLIVVLPCILISSKLFLPTNALFIKT